MWTSVKTKKCNFAVAICNFDGIVKHGLPLLIGDVVELMEECSGWYRGVAVKTKQTGIFPSSYVVVRDYELDSEGPDAVPILVEDAVASEVCTVLREWTAILKNNFQRNQRRTDETLIKLMSNLVSFRKELRSGKFALTVLNEKKMEATKKIDWGNKNLGLHLVPRVNNEPVDVDKTDPIELFKIHEDSSLNSERDSRQTKLHRGLQISNHHLVVKFEKIVCALGEESELHFALYDAGTSEFFTERVLLKVGREGEVVNANGKDLVTVFTDLGERDFGRDAYLVVHMFRLGSLRDSSPPTKTPTLCYKRPYGGGVYNISQILKEEMVKESTVNLKISLCSESDFPQLHENLIKKPSGSTSSGKTEIECQLILTMLHTAMETPITSNPHVPKNAIVTNKIGFPDVIMPDTDRNDLYLTIERGEFERGSKTAQKNIETRVLVITREGQHVEKCISRGTGEPDVNEYNSFIFYHHNNPRWNDTIRLRIPVDLFYNSHVRIEFRHCSNKDRTEKKLLGMCFFRLITDEFTTLADGPRELCFYKFDDARRLQDPKDYLRLPDVSLDAAGGSSGTQSNSPFRRSDKEGVYVATRLCSTKFTQNVTLLGILKWKLEPYRVTEYLSKVILQNGEEIVKFLQYIMDALFDMMSPGSCSHVKPMSVFKAVIHVFHLLKDKRFERFLPVMDAYIAKNFSASLVYKELAKCTIEILEGIVAWGTPANSHTAEQVKLIASLNQTLDSEPGVSSVQLQMRKSVQVLRSIIKCIVQSRILYCLRPGDREKDDFNEIMAGIYGALTRALNTDNATILQEQVVLLHEIPGVLMELSRLSKPVDLCHTFRNLITSIGRTSQMELAIGKLDCLRMMAQMPSLIAPYECKTVLIPMYVPELSRFLQMDKDPKLVAEILMEILASLHCDQKLNVSLKPNLSVILDGLLEPMMNLVDGEMSSPHVCYMVACLTSVLQLMDEKHLQQLLIRYDEKNQLEMFLEKLLQTIRNLIRKNHYPADWLVMRMVTNQVVLQTSKLITAKMKEAFIARKPFNRLPWSSYFYFVVNFVTQPCLQLEKLSPVRRHKLKKKYGDLRLKMVHEFLENWQSLKGNQIHFIPEFVGPFLEMTLVPEPNLRKALMPIFFEMMLREWENTKSFTKLESEIIDQLDILINKHKGDEEFKILFHSELLSKLRPDAEWSNRWKDFVEWATSLLDVLLDYRYVLSHQDSMESQMKCIFNLLNYYSSVVQRQEKYIHYVYRLFDLHVACGNHPEAALTLKLHADLLGWGSMMLPQFSYRYPAQFEWHRMEAIYQKIISEFDKGKMWEYGLPFLEKLADVYKEKILYGKLSEQLKLQAEFYQKILGQQVQTSDSVERYNPTYFLVRFFGLGFSAFLRNKEFIYRGNECENLNTFRNRFLAEFCGATILDSMNVPPESTKQGTGKYLQICSVTPLPKIDPRFTSQKVPDTILSFYRVNNVSEFYFDRPFHSGKKDGNNDFKTLSFERTILKTSSRFPGVMRWFEVTSQKKDVLSPIEVAIDSIKKKNEELNILVMQYKENPGLNVNPLSMMLKGIIDAPVQGGFPKYQEAFFNETFQKENPQYNDHLFKLIELFNNQVLLLEMGMHQHKWLAPTPMQDLHKYIEEKLELLKLQISDSSRLIGYVARKKSHDSDSLYPFEQVNDVRTSVISNNEVNVTGTPNSKFKDKDSVSFPFLKKQRRDSNKPIGTNPATQWYQGEASTNGAITPCHDTILLPASQSATSDLKLKTPLNEEPKSRESTLQKAVPVPRSDDIFDDISSTPPPLPARKSSRVSNSSFFSSVFASSHSQSSSEETLSPNSLEEQQPGPKHSLYPRNSRTLLPTAKPRNSKANLSSSNVTSAELSSNVTSSVSATPDDKSKPDVVSRQSLLPSTQNVGQQASVGVASGSATYPPGAVKKVNSKPEPLINKPLSLDNVSSIRDSPSQPASSETSSTAVPESDALPCLPAKTALTVKERMKLFNPKS